MRLSLARAAAAAATPGPRLQLFQYAICPFCNKTKAALDYLQVRYTTVEVDPLTRSQIKFSKDYKKVPIAVFRDGVVEGGSTEIVDRALGEAAAEEGGGAEAPDVDRAHFLGVDAREWTQWCDEKFAVFVYPNITRTVSECWQALAYLHDCREFSTPRVLATRGLGALGMAAAHGRILKKYGITDERQALEEATQEWEAAVGGRDFRGGVRPDLSDLAVFGCIRGISRLPLYAALNERAGFGAWMRRVASAIEERGRGAA